jgi:hypothetical protein
MHMLSKLLKHLNIVDVEPVAKPFDAAIRALTCPPSGSAFKTDAPSRWNRPTTESAEALNAAAKTPAAKKLPLVILMVILMPCSSFSNFSLLIYISILAKQRPALREFCA